MVDCLFGRTGATVNFLCPDGAKMHSAIRFSVASLDELAVNLDWSPSSLGAPETVNTFIHNVGGRDWLQVETPSVLFIL